MGTYLARPVLAQNSATGSSLRDDDAEIDISWSVVDMQGWRKTMEDAHICTTYERGRGGDGVGTERVATFGVFDGHGGREAAAFVGRHCVEVFRDILEETTARTEGGVEEGEDRGEGGEDNVVAGPNNVLGMALRDTFHRLDVMIDDEKNRSEIRSLTTESQTIAANSIETNSIATNSIAANDTTDDDKTPPSADNLAGRVSPPNPPTMSTTEAMVLFQKLLYMGGRQPVSVPADPTSSPVLVAEADTVASVPPSETQQEKKDPAVVETNDASAMSTETAMEDKKGDTAPSLKVTEDAVESAPVAEEDGPDASATNAEIIDTPMLNETGAIEKKFPYTAEHTIEADDTTMTREGSPSTAIVATKTAKSDEDTNDSQENNTGEEEAPAVPAPVRQVCNLPNHPVHAGCTAIFAVIIGRDLVVANAGDSRGVLCRAGGRAEPLSYDHKPDQPRELSRIVHAGGFVNQFGRVNGNLNLSRSIGDLKYKQNRNVTPAEQMITAEPDVRRIILHDNDEFFLLGCDGIWDCLSNDEAVAYVRKRIQDTPPSEILGQMLKDIISTDPRATQGIGGDNMTCMIVDLMPRSRSYFKDPKFANIASDGDEEMEATKETSEDVMEEEEETGIPETEGTEDAAMKSC
mmetsp:Transcript_35864/g.83615  ORF Transcript_35864/g.83615 Transcript_35864/m.83615 type:complete len:635 (-) Transcript_35864:192-2096(-)